MSRAGSCRLPKLRQVVQLCSGRVEDPYILLYAATAQLHNSASLIKDSEFVVHEQLQRHQCETSDAPRAAAPQRRAAALRADAKRARRHSLLALTPPLRRASRLADSVVVGSDARVAAQRKHIPSRFPNLREIAAALVTSLVRNSHGRRAPRSWRTRMLHGKHAFRHDR